MSAFERSKRRQREFYEFFLPSTIADRRAAINAVVAGTVAGLLLTAISLAIEATWLLAVGIKSPQTISLLAMTLISATATIGVWKHYVSAAIIGLVAAIIFVWWAASTMHSIGLLLLVAVPIVGGFATSIRGIVALRRLNPRGQED